MDYLFCITRCGLATVRGSESEEEAFAKLKELDPQAIQWDPLNDEVLSNAVIIRARSSAR